MSHIGRSAGPLAIGKSRESGRTASPIAASPKDLLSPKGPLPQEQRSPSETLAGGSLAPPLAASPAKQQVGGQFVANKPTFEVASKDAGAGARRASSAKDLVRPHSVSLVAPLLPLAALVSASSQNASLLSQSPPVPGPLRRPTTIKPSEGGQPAPLGGPPPASTAMPISPLALTGGAAIPAPLPSPTPPIPSSPSPAASPAPSAAPVKRDKSPRPSVLNVFYESSSSVGSYGSPSSTPPLTPSSATPPAGATVLNPYSNTNTAAVFAAITLPPPPSVETDALLAHKLKPTDPPATAPQPRLRRSPSEDDIRASRVGGLRRSPSTESFFFGQGTLRMRSQAISVQEKEKERVAQEEADKRIESAEELREVDIRRSIAKTRAERTLRRLTRYQPDEALAAVLAKNMSIGGGGAYASPPITSSPSAATLPVVVEDTQPSRQNSGLALAVPSTRSPNAPRNMSSENIAQPTVTRTGGLAAVGKSRSRTLVSASAPVRLKDLIAMESGEELSKLARRFVDRVDLGARNEHGLTPLHEACEAHAVHLVLELIRLKAHVTLRAAGGNTPLHLLFRSTKWQEFKDHKSLTRLYGMIISAASKYVPHKTDILEAENDRGETLLFRAASSGNFTAVMVLLHHSSNPFASFYPEDAVPTHDDSVRALQAAITDAKDKLSAAVSADSRGKGSKKQKSIGSLLRPPHVPGNKRSDLRSGPPSSWQYMATRMQDDPLALDTLELVNKLFSAAYAHRESWSMMQNVQLTEDQTSLLKEERGRYYVGFAASHEVLQCLRDSFTLWNSSDYPLRYEIARYFPDLATWGAAMLRLEIIGPRRGVLLPGERQRLQVNLFSTTAVEFRQLICVTYTPELPGGASAHARPMGLYFFLAASLRPPPDLQTLEIDRNLLPILSNVLGTGGSASVFRVTNFIPHSATGANLAVKRFNYSIEGGLQETSEDYRRFRLELYISSKMMHPNVVRTYGFVAHPPCLVMEHVATNLRRLIDDRSKPLAVHTQMKIAIHIAKGMAYLHSFNIIHRDLKPGNVLVSDTFDAKVADFGVSLAAKKTGSKSKSSAGPSEAAELAAKVEGTDFYMAPELFAVTPVNQQQLFSLESDIYAFGIVLYELFSRCNLLEVLTQRGFNRTEYYKKRAKGDSPVEGTINFRTMHSAIRDLLLTCWSPVPTNRVAFQVMIDILTELRAELLELSLEEEFEEARKEGLELQEWNARIASANRDDAERFAAELRGNRKVAAALVRYFLTHPSVASETEMALLFELYLGHKGAADFTVNLSSLRPALRELKPAGVEAFLTQVLGTALATPPAMRDQLYRTGLAEDEVLAWFEFVDQTTRDPALRQRLGAGRYDSELSELDRRMEELREELKRCEKRKAKLEAAPPATLFLSELAGLDSLPPELPAALLERLERELEKVAEGAAFRKGEQLSADVRRLETKLHAIERLCVRGTQTDPLLEDLRSKLQELTIRTYV